MAEEVFGQFGVRHQMRRAAQRRHQAEPAGQQDAAQALHARRAAEGAADPGGEADEDAGVAGFGALVVQLVPDLLEERKPGAGMGPAAELARDRVRLAEHFGQRGPGGGGGLAGHPEHGVQPLPQVFYTRAGAMEDVGKEDGPFEVVERCPVAGGGEVEGLLGEHFWGPRAVGGGVLKQGWGGRGKEKKPIERRSCGGSRLIVRATRPLPPRATRSDREFPTARQSGEQRELENSDASVYTPIAGVLASAREGDTVPFRPIHGDHAILEVVFQIALDRPLVRSEIQALAARHQELAEDLPSSRISEQMHPITDAAGGAVFFSLPMTPGDGQTSTPSLDFTAFRRDGNIEWRLQCAGPLITVNCTAYTRWERIWGRARRYLSFVLGHTGEENSRRIQRFLLQYNDFFIWEGSPEEYRIEKLINMASGLVPPSLADRGAVWHLHQGWFAAPSTLTPGSERPAAAGRILERLHVDSVEGMLVGTTAPKLSVRIDHLVQYNLETDIESSSMFDVGGIGDASFEIMHQLNKRRLVEFLNDPVLEEVGLRA